MMILVMPLGCPFSTDCFFNASSTFPSEICGRQLAGRLAVRYFIQFSVGDRDWERVASMCARRSLLPTRPH